MRPRVVLFIDYPNVYSSAREAFPMDVSPRWAGQIDPFKLGELITAKGHVPRALEEVRVYRGRPDSARDPKTYTANVRQSESQIRAGGGRVRVITRTLRYPLDWPNTRAQEKGVDVALAVDFVHMAMAKQYDVGVIMSTDTDLRPALETVLGMRSQGGLVCEVAAWAKPGCHSPRLSIPGARIWCHWLDEADYLSVADPTDYSREPGFA
jgi:uncharacterized LabA/DUF88 family protein